jgi:hypothetical protein
MGWGECHALADVPEGCTYENGIRIVTLYPGCRTLPPVAASVMSKIVVIRAKMTTATARTFLVANLAARGAMRIAPGIRSASKRQSNYVFYTVYSMKWAMSKAVPSSHERATIAKRLDSPTHCMAWFSPCAAPSLVNAFDELKRSVARVVMDPENQD